jgi:poly(A) polymerase Pap1
MSAFEWRHFYRKISSESKNLCFALKIQLSKIGQISSIYLPVEAQSHPDLLKKDGIEWTGSVENKIDILKRAIKILDDGHTYPNYFENTFQAQPRRYQKVIDTGGNLLEN